MLSEGGRGKLQSHVISAMGLVQSPIRTLHQPPLGTINHLGRKASMSAKPIHVLILILFLSHQSLNPGKSFIMTFEIFVPHAMHIADGVSLGF